MLRLFRLKSRKAGSFQNRKIKAGKAGKMVELSGLKAGKAGKMVQFSGLKAGKAGNFRKHKIEIEKTGKFISFFYKMHP